MPHSQPVPTRQPLSNPFVLVALTLFTAAAVGAEATRDVEVLLRDDRTLYGVVDARTDRDTLWLRMQRDGILLSTGFTWDLVAWIWADDQLYSAAEFRDVARRFSVAAPQSIPSHSRSRSRSHWPVENAASWSAERATIRSLDVSASVANWDRDADLDGIEIVLRPRGLDGRVIPLQGGFSADLVGREQIVSPQARRRPFPKLDGWSMTVRPADFSNGEGALYRLPFHDRQLARDVSWQSFGSLTVTLNAVGHGSFEARAPVRLREFNPIHQQWLEYQLRHDEFDRYRGRHW